LARAVGGDLQAAEPARVLRLPDTFNYKYDPPRQVIVEVCEPERRYALADFDRVLRTVEPPRVSKPTPIVRKGFRNTTLMSLAGTMRKRGMTEEAIRAALQAENRTRCEPPLGDDEVDRIVTSVLRYPSGDGTHLDRESKTRPAEVATFSPSDLSVEGRALLDELIALLQRYVILTAHQRHVVALWVMHTHAFAAFETTPYLWITSAVKQSGKTRLLEVLELVVAKPWLTGRVSAAVLVRKVDAERPTVLLDETDAAFKAESDYTEAIRATLNTGYRMSGKASLCIGQGTNITYKDFATFCPKALAGIGQLPDTVVDRSVPIRLERKTRDEKTLRFSARRARAETESLRQRLGVWGQTALTFLSTVSPPEMPAELSDRAADVSEPLFMIADMIGDSWPSHVREAVVGLCGSASVSERASADERLLSDIRDGLSSGAFSKEHGLVSSTAIIEYLNHLDEAPWKESGKQGKGLTTTALATRLKKFRLRPVSEGTFRGYPTDRLNDVFARYLPADLSGCQGTSKGGAESANSARQNEAPVDESESEKPPSETGIPDRLTTSRSDNGHGSASGRHNPEEHTDSGAPDDYVT
jgi:hypothetical protein